MVKRKAEEKRVCRGCPRRASYGVPGGDPTHCAKCAKRCTTRMVNLVGKHCPFEECYEKPTHGAPGTVATHCKAHASREMHPITFADHPASSMWDYERNKSGPESFAVMSGKKAWFLCNNPECRCVDRAFDATISNVTNCGSRCPRCHGTGNPLCLLPECTWCHGRSFAAHPKAAFIVECLGGKQAREVGVSSHTLFLFRCNVCSTTHRFEMSPNKIDNAGNWCPYCGGNKLCSDNNCVFCLSKSLASNEEAVRRWSPNNGAVTPREVRLNATATYLFRCEKCTAESGGIVHESKLVPNRFTQSGGLMCHFCARKLLCENSECNLCFGRSLASHEDVYLWNSAKNAPLIPRNVFLSSGQKAWFTCDRGHDFETAVFNFTHGNRCGRCVNQTEEKVYLFLQSKYPSTERHLVIQRNPPRIMDMAVGKTIVEVDGRQHFQVVGTWDNSCDIERDIEKMMLALTLGYRIIRLYQPDVWADRMDWKGQLIDAIQKDKPVIYLSHDSSVYEAHREAMNRELAE